MHARWTKRLLPFAAALAFASCAGVEGVEEGPEDALLSEVDGEVSLEWLIVDGEQLLSCVDADATEVEIAVLGDSEVRERMSCFGGFAVVEGLSAGTQVVEVSLVGADGEYIVTSELGEVDIVAGATVPLGAIELSL